jgi:hypothetical protein
MKRIASGGCVLAWAAVLLAGGTGAAAPVPKDAKTNPTPELKSVFDTVGKAVDDGKWPAEADEKKLKDTARAVFDRMLKAADQKPRELPVAFDKLTKADVVKGYKETVLTGGFVIAGDVRVTSATDSVIFARGNVQITSATNCVVVAQNVRCTSATNCTVIAGDFIRMTCVDQPKRGDGSVLVAGQWIRTTGMDGTVCHVLRPGGQPAPDEVNWRLNGPHPAIRTNQADGVIFLNDQDQTSANGPKGCTYLPQKNPIAK